MSTHLGNHTSPRESLFTLFPTCAAAIRHGQAGIPPELFSLWQGPDSDSVLVEACRNSLALLQCTFGLAHAQKIDPLWRKLLHSSATVCTYVAIFLNESWVCIPSFSFETFHCCNAKFENRVHSSMYVRFQNSVTWVLLWEGVPPEEHQKKQSSSCSCFCVKVRECGGGSFSTVLEGF